MFVFVVSAQPTLDAIFEGIFTFYISKWLKWKSKDA